jgi:hypothetical protein
MFSVSRFVLTGKLGLRSANLSKITEMNSSFIKFNFKNFLAKVNDGTDRIVDKSKRSVSGGSGASDSEGKREIQQQRISKTSIINQEASHVETHQAVETPVPTQAHDVETEVANSKTSIKVIQTIAGHKVIFK